MARAKVALATDCSGMETPLMALRSIGVDVRHVFACDCDANVKATIMANCKPDKFYDDVTTRDNASAPKCDLYVAGFPCQPFSLAGHQEGFKDAQGRGTIFWNIREYIDLKRPKAFVLENVVGLMGLNEGKYYKAILKSLNSLGSYSIVSQVLDTSQHGVPQNRRRVYFVGIRGSRPSAKKAFEFPQPLPHRSIEELLEPKRGKVDKTRMPPASATTACKNVKVACRKLIAAGEKPFKDAFVVDVDSSTYRFKAMRDMSPCLLATRTKGHWITSRGRRMTLFEQMRLQGMTTKGFKQVVSNNQLGKQVGNAMSANVLERLFVRILPAAGIVPPETKLVDRWAVAAAAQKRKCSDAPMAPTKAPVVKIPKALPAPRLRSRPVPRTKGTPAPKRRRRQ